MFGGPTLTRAILVCLVEIPRRKRRKVISKTKCLVTGSGESGPRPRLPFDFIKVEETKSRGRSSGHCPWKALLLLARRVQMHRDLAGTEMRAAPAVRRQPTGLHLLSFMSFHGYSLATHSSPH